MFEYGVLLGKCLFGNLALRCLRNAFDLKLVFVIIFAAITVLIYIHTCNYVYCTCLRQNWFVVKSERCSRKENALKPSKWEIATKLYDISAYLFNEMEKSLNFEYILHTCAGAELFLINIFFCIFFLLF